LAVPRLAVLLCVLAFSLIDEGMRDALDASTR
jgi:ABC-type dipeptide/oligopeptide/nickel transport system permease subunit